MPLEFHNITIVEDVLASGVGRSWTIYGTHWCAANHTVYISDVNGYL